MSRWLWLIKWLLAIPHYFLLAFLWIAFVVVSSVAFFAILFTGRYPRGMFEFNVGVLRWSWRVSYYTYGALGTDRYPPFTLAEVPDYPAHLDIDYPTHLSRGLVLVKSWLLAIPHYLIVGVFLGGGTWALWQTTDRTGGAPGLIGLLVLIAAIVLIFTGRYPQQIFDFVLGMNRWALRVAAYAGLMTDEYPPFRLDMGGQEASGTMTLPAPVHRPTPGSAPAPVPPNLTKHPTPAPGRRGWTGGRITSLVIGSIIGLMALGVLTAGGVATWATSTQRDGAGFLTTTTRDFSTPSFAVTSQGIDLGSATDWVTPADALGTLRLRATAADPTKPVFIGVGPQSQVNRYLAGVSHLVVTDWASNDTRTAVGTGNQAPATAPALARVWTAQTTGSGTQSLTWRPTGGDWVIVVMNATGGAGVSVTADAAATIPDLAWFAAALLGIGALMLAGAVLLIAIPVVRASR